MIAAWLQALARWAGWAMPCDPVVCECEVPVAGPLGECLICHRPLLHTLTLRRSDNPTERS